MGKGERRDEKEEVLFMTWLLQRRTVKVELTPCESSRRQRGHEGLEIEGKLHSGSFTSRAAEDLDL